MSAKPGDWLASLSSKERKEVALERGLFAYFPDALALIARHSVRSNEKHNPGQPVHWAREKSTDHGDCIARHHVAISIDRNSLDDGQPHIVCRAWRALADLQLWAEEQKQEKPKDGFIPWLGNRVAPVSRDTKVIVRFRDGREMSAAPASEWSWYFTNDHDDVVAYKVVS